MISGGQGSDQFWVVNGQIPNLTDLKVIADFEIGVDRIGIGTDIGLSFADINFNATADGSNTIISVNGNNVALLANLDLNSLPAKEQRSIFVSLKYPRFRWFNSTQLRSQPCNCDRS
ncbi:MAG: hypothetical protein QNJ38_02715 [Prochloraceae cyanobacterium]|nr:hypothetical protein [Prochloraceae cyanobacterium]